MNLNDLREAQTRFENRINDVLIAREDLYRIRTSFVKYFTPQRIQNMDIDNYVAGLGGPARGFNFCYALERQLDGLGRIIGATAFKFGVYWSKENEEYRFTQKFGENYEDAFESVRHSIIELLKAGRKEDIDAIANNILSPMFKGKILCTYFPDRYLNIFSPDHLDYYLKQLDLDTDDLIAADAVYKREALVKFKNQDSIMRKWKVDLFAAFLYSEYPGRPPREGEDIVKSNDPLIDFRIPNFPTNQKPSYINLNILPQSATKKSKVTIERGKINYEKEARRNKKLGDRGEKIVVDLEKKRLLDAGRKDLAKKIERVSLKSDSLGYDIVSFEENGKKRYIEVKATRSKAGSANFFLSANELETAKELKNYFVYIVFDITSASPKIWPISNPFNPENRNLIKTPVKYRVSIKAR